MLDYDFSKGHIGINLYSALISKELNEDEKAKLIAEAVEEVAKKFPNLEKLATRDDLEITKLELQKEIKELDIKLTKEIKDSELRLTKEIKELDREIKNLDIKFTKEIELTKSTLLKWSFGFWISQMMALLGIGFFVFRALNM